MRSRYDLVVVGGGTAGLVAAAGGAYLGARVALVERDRLGGECLNYGCVPTKALVRSAGVASLMRRAGEFGVKPVEVEVDFPAVMERMREMIRVVGVHDSPGRFRRMGVDVFLESEARLDAPGEVMVDGWRIPARSVILATGSHSSVPPVEGLEETGYMTHVEALRMESLPGSIVIIGAGPVGCEFAQIFARFGCRVSVISSSSLPLPREEQEVSERLLRTLLAEGITFHGGFRAEAARREGKDKVVVARDEAGGAIEERAEEILIAAGRAPTVDGLNLEDAGVELGESGIKVDDNLRTTVPGVYAAGDITGGRLFTHVAEYEGKLALRNALFPVKARADYRVVPWTTFTDPEVARVGLTEEEARREHEMVEVFRHPFGEVDRAVTDGETEGFVKVVAGKGGEILGAHIIGPGAGDLIHEFVLAMQRGIPLRRLSTMIHVYPTLSQVNQRVADGYYREKLFTATNRKVLGTFFGLRRLLS